MTQYQQVNIADGSLVSTPGPLPANLVGLANDTLADLSAGVKPAPVGLAGRGFWPVVETIPAYDATAQTPDGTVAYTADPATRTVRGVAGLRAMTTAELAVQLGDARSAKAAVLASACSALIVGGFTSSALGAPFTYPSGATDQANLSASVLASLMPGNPSGWTTPFLCADASGAWAFRDHTAAEIQRVGQDAKDVILAARVKLAGLQAKVAAAAVLADVAAISW